MTDVATAANGKTLSLETSYDVAVIGAGQAGLAIGYYLRRADKRFVILEAGEEVATAWRERWDSLVLFTPRRYDALPGLEFPGDPDGYPSRDEVIAYLENYAETFELPIEFNTRVAAVRPAGDVFVLEVDGRRIEAAQVVVATGPFQTPRIPKIADEIGEGVVHTHSTSYRRAADLPEGTVLVVGGGNTGFQIAKELAGTRDVHLAIGSRQTPLPQRILGRDVFWWLTKLGLLQKDVNTRLAQRAKGRDTLIGSRPRKLRRHGVTLRQRAVAASGRTIGFEDGSELDVDGVVWATGYRPDYAWIDAPIFETDGRPRHTRGVTGLTGLYFLGLSWQWTRGSALLGWVKDDAEFLAQQIEAEARTRGALETAARSRTQSEPITQGA